MANLNERTINFFFWVILAILIKLSLKFILYIISKLLRFKKKIFKKKNNKIKKLLKKKFIFNKIIKQYIIVYFSNTVKNINLR